MGTLSTTANDTVTFRAVLPQVPFGAQRGPFVFLFGGLSFAPLTDRIHVIRSLQMVSVGPSPCGSPGQPIAGDSCRLSGLVAGKRDRSLSLATFPPTASHSSPAMVGPHTFGSSVSGLLNLLLFASPVPFPLHPSRFTYRHHQASRMRTAGCYFGSCSIR